MGDGDVAVYGGGSSDDGAGDGATDGEGDDGAVDGSGDSTV